MGEEQLGLGRLGKKNFEATGESRNSGKASQIFDVNKSPVQKVEIETI